MVPEIPITGRTSREITDSVEAAVNEGELTARQALPSVRELANWLGVSPSTVAAAYRDLRMRGVVTSQAGKATRVSSRPPVSVADRVVATSPSGLRDLSDGNPDRTLLPDIEAVLRRVHVPRYLYGEPTVLPELAHEQFADVGAQAGADVGPVAVVGGAMDGVERVLASCARLGDRVVVEDPGHTGLLELVRAMGLEPVGVAVDGSGPVPDDLARALQRRPVAVVVTPRAQNPTGAAIDAERGGELREVLAGHPAVAVIENDHASFIAGVPYHSLCGRRGTWAVVRSTSKYLGPDLRMGFVAGDRRTIGRVAGRHLVGAGWVSHVLQHVAVELLHDAEIRSAIERTALVYRERREALQERLAERGVAAVGRSGYNVMVPVPQEVSVVQAMQARGWALRAGEVHRISSAPFVRITTATMDDDESARLARDLAEVHGPQQVSHLT